MSDSFFVLPGNKKRKKSDQSRGNTNRASIRRKATRDEDDDLSDIPSNDEELPDAEEELEESGDDSDDEERAESAGDKRRRLAKQYIENIQKETSETANAVGFLAEDLERDLIAQRLKEDVAEHKGKVYKFLESRCRHSFDPQFASYKAYGITSVALDGNGHAFTVSKDKYIMKWQLNASRKPTLMRFVRSRKVAEKPAPVDTPFHTKEILCCAVSPDGKYLATGSRDKRIIVWSAENLAFVTAFDMRDRKGDVLGMCFRMGTNELYASCADLKIRTFNLDHLSRVETLFGHQDAVADISALSQERCVSVGSRDRTAMLWKISEETRLTFRSVDNAAIAKEKKPKPGQEPFKDLEGSIDCCSMIDDQLFVTGSDNGNICLWSAQKKKPIFVVRGSHGRNDTLKLDDYTAETSGTTEIASPEPQLRPVTAIHAIPLSNIFLTGSHSGEIKVWKLGTELRSFELLNTIPEVNGMINRIDAVEQDDKTIKVVAAVSREPRLGRWMKLKARDGIFSVSLA